VTAALLRLLARLEALRPHQAAVEYAARALSAVVYRAVELSLAGALLYVLIQFAWWIARQP